MHGSSHHPSPNPITAAEALKQEFAQLHGPLPPYHDWLVGLPAEPRLWHLRKDHFKDARSFVSRILHSSDALAMHLRAVLRPDTAASLCACHRTASVCESLLEALAYDLNHVITSGQPLFTPERFAGIKLSAGAEALLKSAPRDQQLEKLNRLLLEEAFPDGILRVADTLAGACALFHTRERTALCLSGGGIRSATFGLGVLQGLARRDLLGQFDYLSTVSGGGYIGSWLSSWIHHAGSPQAVFNALKQQTTDVPVDPEPAQLRHLRRFSNYLTPRLGSFSADTWTLAGTYLRNLFLNWSIFLPLLVAVLALPRLFVSLLQLDPEPWALTTVFITGFVLGGIAIAYGAVQRPGAAANLRAHNKFWSRRGDQESFLCYCLAPLYLGAVCFTAFWAWLPRMTFEMPPWWVFAVGGPALHLFGWTLSAVILRRASIMEFFGVVFTGAVGGSLLWLLAREAFTNLSFAPDLELYVCLALPCFLLVFLLTATLFIGLGSWRTSDADREWWARMGAWVLIATVAWSGFSSLILFGPLALLALPPLWTLLGGLPGLFTLIVGFSQGTSADAEENKHAGWKGRIMQWGLSLAAPAFVLFAVALVSLGTTLALRLTPALAGSTLHLDVVHNSPLWLTGALVLGCAALGFLMSRLININKFSLHSVYRNRLIRAYLGASNPKRDPNPFTGFDPRDNLRLYQLGEQRPLHVVNIALNLVSDDNLAWQHRKAETFTASALHAGNYRLGYRRAVDFAQNEKHEGLSLGSAVTISGAAASPNQGYHSSPVVALLMTLFNVRLGAWLGNPGPAGAKTFTNAAPHNSALHVLKEAFGLTDDDSPYVYLSDGGHFENLGLYEMVLRRCHRIVVSDAGCDPGGALEDLGNAIRKIRIDLGVPIEMDHFDIHSRNSGTVGKHCAVGWIRYDKVDGPSARRGLLIYIKPSLTGDEPRDVFNYAQTSPEFPHEPTSDQWFSESQFESYRTLGLHAVTEMCQDWERTRAYYAQETAMATFARQTFLYLERPHLNALLQTATAPAEPMAEDTANSREDLSTPTVAATTSAATEPPKSF